MKGFIKWLLGTPEEVVKEVKEVKEAKETKVVESVDPGLGTGIEAEKFVDSETGREYKSARSLKAAQTRRKNAAKKGKKTTKKKTKKSKK